MTYRILMIEDENNIRTTRFDLENDFGCDISVAETAVDAYKELSEQLYDLIIVDVQIPESVDGDVLDFGGLEVMESLIDGKLGSLNKEVRYLVLTAQQSSLARSRVVNDPRCLGVVRKISQSDAIRIIGGYLASKANTGREEDFSGPRNGQ